MSTEQPHESAEPPPGEAAGPPARPRSNWTAGRVVGMVFTSIGGLIGLALLIGGIAVLAAWALARDEDGFFTTDRARLESSAFAITTEEIDLGVDADEWAPDGVLGEVRIRVESAAPVFVGIGSDTEVSRYLATVATDELVDFDDDVPEFELHQGGPPPNPPGDEGFWEAQAEGSGEQTVEWDADFGRWTAVVMNADGSRGVTVDADAGVKLDWAIWAGVGMLVVGLVMTAGAVAIILLIGRRASRDSLPGG